MPLARAMDVAFDGRPLVVQPARVSAYPMNQVWAGYQRPVEQSATASFVSVDLAKTGELSVTPSPEEDLGEPVILPLSWRPKVRREGRTLKIAVDRPRQFAVFFGKDAPVLHVFANPPFDEPHARDEIVFGPGEHDVGVIVPKSGQTVRIEEGAVVYGAIFIAHAHDVTVTGRGIVDGSRLARADHDCAAYKAAAAAGLPGGFYGAEMAVTTFTSAWSTNVVVRGVTFRDPPRWTMIVRAQSKNVLIDNVKIVGCWRYNADGINVCASEDVTIRNSFVRSFDDCIVARGAYLDCGEGPTRNVTAENCVLWCDWGKCLEVWAGHKPCLIENVRYRDIACLAMDAFGCDVTTWFASPATTIRNVTVEDVEFDFARTRYRAKFQKSRQDTAFPRRIRDTANLLQVDVSRYGRYLGNQQHEPAKDLSAFRVNYENLAFRRFKAYGDVPKLVGTVDATTSPHEIRGFAAEDLPAALDLTVKGAVTGGLPDFRREGMSAWKKGSHQIGAVACADGRLTGHVRGGDPFWAVSVKPFRPSATQEVVFRGKSPVGGTGEFFWAPAGARQPTQKTGVSFAWVGDGEWHEYRVRPYWQGEGDVWLLRVDFPNGMTDKGEVGLADFHVVEARRTAPLPLDGAEGVAFSCRSRTRGFGLFRWATDSARGRSKIRFPLSGDGNFHRYYLALAGGATKGRLEDWQFVRAGSDEPLEVRDFRVCAEVPDDKSDILPIDVRWATPACRAGTEGRIEAVLRNVGATSVPSVALRVLDAPKELTCRADAPKLIADGNSELMAVAVKGGRPFEGTVRVAVEAEGKVLSTHDVAVRIGPSLGLAKSAGVPEPRPPKCDYEIGALYFPGWSSAEAWKRVWRTCPERRPYLGWYDEANPEVVDWQVKWLAENGIRVLYVDWYWERGHRHLEHWVKAFQRAKWRKYMKWAIMWANHTPEGTHSEADQRAVTKYWIDHCFNTPEYLTRDGKPVVWIWQSQNLDRDCGPGGCRRLLEISRQMAVEAGFKGIHFMAMKWPEDACTAMAMEPYRDQGFDEVGIYHFLAHGGKAASDRRYAYALVADANPANWRDQQAAGVMPFLPNLSTGWDDRPWNDSREVYGKNAADFRRICAAAKAFADETGVKRLCLAPINEWGEGSYAEPNAEHGFGFYEAVRDTFCEKPAEGWPVNCVPADVGLGPYDLPLPPQPQPVTAWNFTKGDRHGWQTFMGATPMACTAAGVAFTTTSRDPAMHVAFVRLQTKDFASVTVRMKAEGAQGHAALFWAGDREGMRAAACATLPLFADGRFHDYVFRLAGHPEWKGRIGALRFDPCENAGAKITVSSVRLTP